MLRVVAMLPSVVGRARDAEVATGGRHRVGAGVLQDRQSVLGLPTQHRGIRQPRGGPREAIAQAQTGVTADPLKLPPARLTHEGTSSDLGERPTHQARGYVPSSRPFTVANLSERDQEYASQPPAAGSSGAIG